MRIPEIIGSNYFVNTSNGTNVKYLNLDNAATTPTFRPLLDKLREYLETYGSVHRGSGQKSQISTAIYEEAIPIIMDFLNVTTDEYALIHMHNSTSLINKLTRMLQLTKEDTIFLSEFEHSSNDLPWRKNAQIVRIPIDKAEQLNIGYLEEMLRKNTGNGRKIVVVTGASNVTGTITPIHIIAKMAHTHGATIVVDAAQLVAHREINLKGDSVGEEVDFIVFSGHKMYAPFGGAVIVGRKDFLEKMTPDDVGGGNIDFVLPDSYDLSKDFYKRMTAGSPNALGLVSLALSCVFIKKHIGFEDIFNHEQDILNRAKSQFSSLAGMQTYCDLDYDANKKCSILTFNLEGIHPGIVAARLGHEYGIGVRQGAICQFLYVATLLGLHAEQVKAARQAVLSGKMDSMYGIVRASFGLGNKPEDVDSLAEALSVIIKTSEKSKNYILDEYGEFWPLDKQRIKVKDFYKI
jgi:cysteine desulfurase / selenocysteine lyase